jgi:hypothetical protein
MTASSRTRLTALALAAAVLAGACGSNVPTPSPTQAAATEAPLPTVATPATAPTPTPTVTPTPAPSASPTPAPTADPTASPTAAPSPTQGMPTGRTGTIALDEIGLTLTLPKGWRSIPLTEEDVREIMAILPDGTLPAGFEDQVTALMASGLKLFALDIERANQGANINVVWVPTQLSLPLMRLAAEVGVSQIGGIRDVAYKEVKVDGEPALRVAYTVTLKLPGGKMTSSGVQLWVSTGGGTAAITITTPKGGQLKDRDALIRSLRLD